MSRRRQPALLFRSDASGDHGFGVCVNNIHIFGRWRDDLAPLIEHNMLFKELLPFVISAVLLAPHFPGYVFGVSSDNAGMVFRTNAGSSRDSRVQRLLRLLARQITVFGITPLADWNHRSFADAVHADKLSKIFSVAQWHDLQPRSPSTPGPSWIIDLILHDLTTGSITTAAFRIPAMH